MPELLTSDSFDFEKLFTVPNGEPLPDDGPGDDRSDTAMAARLRSYRQAEDLHWLVDGARAPEPTAKPASDALKGLAGAAAMDMGMGAVEAPRQIVGGMRDAVQSIMDLGDELDRGHIAFTDIPLSLGGITFTDEKGNFSLDYKSPSEWRALTEGGQVTEPDLPTVSGPSTVTGGGIRAMSQFMARRV